MCPETTIIFVTYKRSDIAERSYLSLENALTKFRQKIKIIISDATPYSEKLDWIRRSNADDIIWTPNFTSAATSRNIAVNLMLDKYSTEYICLLEDDFEYTENWYPALIECCKKYYGRISPWGLAYGMFSASPHPLEKEKVMMDKEIGLKAYLLGLVADQRFMPSHHYLSCLRFWDPDILGISSGQTGLQSIRNTNRGFCGGVITNMDLCREIPEQISTWKNIREVGGKVYESDLTKYHIFGKEMVSHGIYSKDSNKYNNKLILKEIQSSLLKHPSIKTRIAKKENSFKYVLDRLLNLSLRSTYNYVKHLFRTVMDSPDKD